MTSYSLYTKVHCEKKRTVAYYNLFLSNLQHNLLKFKSLKFKCLKIAEGNYEAFACVWAPLCCCLSSAADLRFSNTFKVKCQVNGLYTSESINADHRALLPLAASPDQPPQQDVPEIMPLSGLVWTYRASAASSRINITKEPWPLWPHTHCPETTGTGSQGRLSLWPWAVWSWTNHSPLWASLSLIHKSVYFG